MSRTDHTTMNDPLYDLRPPVAAPVHDGPSQWAHTRAARLHALGRRRIGYALGLATPTQPAA